jgi:hypothetical protein
MKALQRGATTKASPGGQSEGYPHREAEPRSAQQLYFCLKKYRQIFAKAMLFPANDGLPPDRARPCSVRLAPERPEWGTAHRSAHIAVATSPMETMTPRHRSELPLLPKPPLLISESAGECD